MKRISITAFIVLALVTIDVTITMSYAKAKTTIYKVTKLSPDSTLKLRAWPSPKSRIKTQLPYNAKDLTETGKQRIIGKTKWLEVNWQQNQGWVEADYLKKTGVLLHAKNKASRNNKALEQPTEQLAKSIIETLESIDERPEELVGDRYDQPEQIAATEIKTAFTENEENNSSLQILLCDGANPKYWNIKMDVADKNMQIRFSKSQTFNVPINYHAWATPNRLRMNIGGNQGRNIVDVNLEKTNACYNGITKTRFSYEVNATINKEFYTGCCEVVTK
jgi:uncharacterized membrane protein